MRSRIVSHGIRALQVRLKQSELNTHRLCVNAMHRSVLEVEAEVAKRAPVDRSRLRAGIGSRVRDARDRIIGIIAIVNVPYATVMEYGRRPGTFPPIAPIAAWVRRKGIATGAQARQVAFLIARKMARVGIKGRFFFRDGTTAAMPKIRHRFAGLGRLIVRR